MLSLMLNSIVIGLSIAAPVGPIGVLCIRRTLVQGRWQGFASGMGAATADGVYGFIAAFGLTAVSALLLDYALFLQIFGGGFLLFLGIKNLRSSSPQDSGTSTAALSGGLASAYSSTFLLTITNPMTILAFLGIFAGLGAEQVSESRASAIIMVSGVFLGSALWWMLLSGGVSILRERVTPSVMLWINRISGVIIILFALKILGSIAN